MRSFLFVLLLMPMMRLVGFEYVIIAHVPEAVELDEQSVQDIFLGRQRAWGDQSTINLVVQQKGDLHDTFMAKVVGRTGGQFINHWKRRVFRGRGPMPKEVLDSKAVLNAVGEREGAIGYISKDLATELPDGVVILPVKKE